jgi:hypothetical protein
MDDSEKIAILENRVSKLEEIVSSLKKYVKTDSLGNLIKK